MKKQVLIGAPLLFAAVGILAPALAGASNNYTPACTQINNTAHVSFKVGGVDQGPSGNGLDSTTASFYVGVKVNVSVASTDSNNVTVYPGSTAAPLTFTVTNNGNAHQKYALSYVAEVNGTPSPFSGSDAFNSTGVTLSSAAIADLAPDASQTITISADTPLSQTDAQVAVYALKAQTQWLGTSTDVTADGSAKGSVIGGALCPAAGPGTADIDVVVGDGAGSDDGARDGAHSARDAYQVTAANLTIQKSSAVVYDPVNCSSYSPLTCSGAVRAIPGAVVEYTIQIANSANGTATNVTVKDAIDSSLSFYADGYASTKGIQVTSPNINGGAPLALSNGSDADQGDFNATNAGAVTVTGIQVAKDDTAYVKFRASIK